MSRIEWDESFSMNHTEIDTQHKKWIDIYNRMDAALLDGGPELQMTISTEVLQAMLDYSRYHFKFEEEYLHSIAYTDIVKHARRHKDFDTLIYQSYRAVCDGEAVLNTELLSMIKSWLLNHILVEDRKYSQFISNHKEQVG